MAAASYGSIEFATVALGTKLVVVMGHQRCGAVDAALKRPDVPGHIVRLLQLMHGLRRSINTKYQCPPGPWVKWSRNPLRVCSTVRVTRVCAAGPCAAVPPHCRAQGQMSKA